MNEDRPLFILAGNAGYDNRGCEAIVRGTVKILRMHFRDPRFVCLSHFQSEKQYRKQYLEETDDAIVHLASNIINKNKIVWNIWKPDVWDSIYKYYLNKGAFYSKVYNDMFPYLNKAQAVLSVGGDNYSLDYGLPTLFTALDDLVLEHRKPIILWGSSVGPFSAMPDYERYMTDHLKKVTGILARESVTIRYLDDIGLKENVYPVADPAFLMDAVKLKEKIYIEDQAIGLNLSPLMAKFVTGGDLEQWAKIAAAIIAKVANVTESRIYLIPHVTNPNSNDYTFMQTTLSMVQKNRDNITLVPPIYDAAQTKWIISKMAVFAGARTHSTIAALSSGVPTLSFAYSIKTRGINQDIFCNSNNYIEPKDMDANIVSERIFLMLNEATIIRRDLKNRIPKIQNAAQNAGIILKQLIGEG